jgi:hypothetical protein
MWHFGKNMKVWGCSMISGRTKGISAFPPVQDSFKFGRCKMWCVTYKRACAGVFFARAFSVGVMCVGLICVRTQKSHRLNPHTHFQFYSSSVGYGK